MEFVAIVTVISIFEYAVFGLLAGLARGRAGIKAPAITGDPEFERYYRVQQNTLERLVIFLPTLWIFSAYLNPIAASSIGILFVVGRGLYARGYIKDPQNRSLGFFMGEVSTSILMLGALMGAVRSLSQSDTMDFLMYGALS